MRAVIFDAQASGAKLVLQGGGTMADVGAPAPGSDILSLRGLAGVVDYDPSELVLTVRPGTSLAEVQALVASKNQMLAFEPFDGSTIFGRPPGAATIGGVVAAGIAGSQRLSQGSARDHLLGLRAVSGSGNLFVAGAKVVKNVTGYDLPKLLAGSWGRLAAITELTLKVLPAPRTSRTLALDGLDPPRAVAAMAAAMGSKCDVAAAAHLPGLTVFRLQGFAQSVAARAAALARRLEPFGPLRAADAAVWDGLRTLDALPADRPLWRVSIPPAAGGGLVQALEAQGAAWLLDWAGGLAWIAHEDEAAVRAQAAGAGGHAMLFRAPGAMRARIPALPPLAQGVAALEARVRRAFDPHGVFETGRF